MKMPVLHAPDYGRKMLCCMLQIMEGKCLYCMLQVMKMPVLHAPDYGGKMPVLHAPGYENACIACSRL